MELTEENLYVEYIQKNQTLKECATIFNVSEWMIRDRVKKYNFIRTPDAKHEIAKRVQKLSTNKHRRLDQELEKIAPFDLFKQYFVDENLSSQEAAKRLKITKSEFARLQNLYGLFKTQIQARNVAMKTLNQRSISKIISSLDIEELKSYYIDQNHSEIETMEKFALKKAAWNKIRKHFNLYKSKRQQTQRTLHTKGLETLEEIVQRIDKTTFESDLKIFSYAQLMEKYDISVSMLPRVIDYLGLERKLNPGSDTSNNIKFEQLLISNNITYKRETTIYYQLYPKRKAYKYDFEIGDYFIEIDPSITHSPSFPWRQNTTKVISQDYHQKKTEVAKEYGFKCIHIWDWDNQELVLKTFFQKQIKIYARQCSVKHISKKDADDFLCAYHLQGTCNGQKVRYGLFYSNELIGIMTFGKARYNKKYEWELFRLCFKPEFKVIGGTQKLFTHFLRDYNPINIISYCDLSKFSGEIYLMLGFDLLRINKPSRHWYNVKTKQHITDNLLRQRGFDQLFKTSYGKGTSNEQLMLDHKFIDIYDCGQATYIYSAKNKNEQEF